MAVVFAAALGTSVLLGKSAVKSCLWAVLVTGVACIGSLIPIVYAVLSGKSLSIPTVLAASVIRLLLMISGAIIIMLFVKTDALWFVIWLSVFYVVMLFLEVRVFAGAINKPNRPV